MTYEVALKKSKEGYAVWCPALKGCWSQGKTRTEALENIESAIREYLSMSHKLAKKSRAKLVQINVAA